MMKHPTQSKLKAKPKAQVGHEVNSFIFNNHLIN